jgi:hypothetical protein
MVPAYVLAACGFALQAPVWTEHFPPKCWWTYAGLHGVMSQGRQQPEFLAARLQLKYRITG